MADPFSPSPTPASHPSHLGALLIGAIITSALAGVTGQQTCFYFTRFTNDGVDIKLWVFSIWLFDFMTAFLYSTMVYIAIVTHFSDPFYSAFNSWAWDIGSILTGVTIFLVQTFFIGRIWRLRQIVYPHSRSNVVLCLLFTAMAFFSLSTSAAMTYYDFYGQAKGEKSPKDTPLYLSNVSVQTALDVFITAALIHILNQNNNEFTRKKNPFEQLVIFFATRGILLAAYQILLLILPFALPDDYLWIAFLFSLSKVYANSALMTLNNRSRHPTIVAPGGPQPRSTITSMEFTIPNLHTSTSGAAFDTHPRTPGSQDDVESHDSNSGASRSPRAESFKELAKTDSSYQGFSGNLDMRLDNGKKPTARKGRPWSP